MADRYEAADKAICALMGPKIHQKMFEYFQYPYHAYITDPHLFRPKPKALVEIERLMEGLTYRDVPEDEQWWFALEAAVLRLYKGELLLDAGVVTKQQLETGDF